MKHPIVMLGELATAIAVIISLLLLVKEIDANTKATLYQIEADRIARIRDAADSPYIPEIIAKVKETDSEAVEPATAALIENYSLSFTEADRLSRHLGAIWEGLQADYRYGIRDAKYVQELLSYPDQQIFWENSAYRFDPCFARWVSSIRNGESLSSSEKKNSIQKLLSVLSDAPPQTSGNCEPVISTPVD